MITETFRVLFYYRIIPLPVSGSPGSIGVDLDTEGPTTPASEDISTAEDTASMTSVFIEAITEVDIMQEGSVEERISRGSVNQLETEAAEEKGEI